MLFSNKFQTLNNFDLISTLAISDYIWISLVKVGYLWLYMAISAHVWFSLPFSSYLWISLAFFSCICLSLLNLGFFELSQAILG